MAIPVILDTDPGVDDFVAIAMLAATDEVSLLGLTTVGGNASLADTTANALRALHALGRDDVPVAAGAEAGLTRPFQYAPEFHGPTGLAVSLPLPERDVVSLEAVEWLRRTLESATSPATVLPVGPLTNIAKLLVSYPEVARNIKRMIVMGGAVDCPGNVTEYAEFNIWNDPEAADLAFGSGIPLTLVGLDVCNIVAFGRDDALPYQTPSGRMLRAWFASHPARDLFHLCDPLAVAVALDGSLVEIEEIALSVDCSDGPTRGNTFRDSGGSRVSVATGVDAERAIARVRELAF